MSSAIPPSQRTMWLDYLRAVAILMVVLHHVIAKYMAELDPFNPIFYVVGAFYLITHTAVPLFVMISGALLLNKKPTPNQSMYERRIKPFILPILFWNTVYFSYLLFGTEKSLGEIGEFAAVGGGFFHLWYMTPFLMLMLLYPTLNSIFNHAEARPRDLIITFCTAIFALVMSQIYTLVIPSSGWWLKMFPVFIFYFLLGGFLAKYIHLIKINFITATVLFFIFFGISSALESRGAGVVGYDTILTVAMSTSLFCMFMLRSEKIKPRKSISNIAAVSFGMYLIHYMFIFHIQDLNLHKHISIMGAVAVELAVVALLSFIVAHYAKKQSLLARLF